MFTPFYSNENDDDNMWFALLERGGCPFLEKVRNMQLLGASGVIVADDFDHRYSRELVKMTALESGDTSDVKIPSVFISYFQLKHIENLMEEFPNYKLVVSLIDDSESNASSNISFM